MKERQLFIDFVNMILKRPAMYQVNKVEDLWLVMFGYQCSLSEGANKNIGDMLLDFRKFVNKDFDSKEDFSWDKLVRLYSGSDSHSLELFNQVFSQFILQYKE